MTTNYRQVVDYSPNDLNKNNTYEDSGIVEFMVGDVKFALGFWANPHQDTEYPYLALISWTPGGWIVVGNLPMIWNDDIAIQMGMDTKEENLKQYAFFIGDQLTPLMQQYLTNTGGAPVSLKNWQKIRLFLNSVKVIDGEIVVSHD